MQIYLHANISYLPNGNQLQHIAEIDTLSANSDIKHAFRLLPVHSFLGLTLKIQIFIDTCPFLLCNRLTMSALSVKAHVHMWTLIRIAL